MKTLSKYILLAVITLPLALLSGCDNSTSAEEEEEEPVGLRVKSGDVIIVEQDATGAVTGSITIGESSSETYTVAFVGENGDEIFLDPEEHALTFDVSDTNTATVSQQPGLDQTYIFTIEGVAVGNTNVTISLLHEGAAEFVTQLIPVVVN